MADRKADPSLKRQGDLTGRRQGDLTGMAAPTKQRFRQLLSWRPIGGGGAAGERRRRPSGGKATGGGRAVPGLGASKPVLLWRRMFFTKAVRGDVWQLLADILEGGSDISRTLEAMAEAYRAQGKPVVATVLIDLRESIPRKRFAERVGDYCGPAERLILQGYGEADTARIFGSAARLVRMELAMRSAIVNAVALPVVLVVGLIGIVFLFGLKLYPALEQIADFETLPVFQQWVIAIVNGIVAWPLPAALAIGAFAMIIALALPNWKGPGRVIADKVFPFSLARLTSGAGFLFSVIEAARSGQSVTTHLFYRMARATSPYARSRITAIANCYVGAKNNLGAAALMAGQGFPAPELGAILKMLWNEAGASGGPDGIERAGRFVDRWLANIEMRLKARMIAVNGVLLALIAAALIVLMSVALPIIEQITGELYS